MKFEYKYIVPIERLPELRTLISPFMVADTHMDMGGPEGYTVRSIYFDTFQYDDYYEKISGIKIRKKIRIRGYNGQNHKNIVFLEIKRKNEKRVRKHRAPVKFKNLKNLLISGDTERFVLTIKGFKDAIEDSRQFLFHMYKKSLRPVVLVIYEREAYHGTFDNSMRITFDKNLRSTIHPDIQELYQEEYIKYSIPNHFVLEVKFFDIFPSWLRPVIASLNLKLQAFSKYTTCVDEHNAVNNNSRDLKHDFVRQVCL
ncbi:MAG TPA: polyphosphate polymerase domain-containing protein [Anaerolineae bacterium]|nr:polyphosphate polymerase domain-containing protein [Anaerolineae bacterium]